MPFDRQCSIGRRSGRRSNNPGSTAARRFIRGACSENDGSGFSTIGMVSVVTACEWRHYLALFDFLAQEWSVARLRSPHRASERATARFRASPSYMVVYGASSPRSCESAFPAARCSASFLFRPHAGANRRPVISAAIWKCLLWSGPHSSTIR